jgi:hypothetical protein
MASKALRNLYNEMLGKKLTSKLTDSQIEILAAFYNDLSEDEQRSIDLALFKEKPNTLVDMAEGMAEENKPRPKLNVTNLKLTKGKVVTVIDPKKVLKGSKFIAPSIPGKGEGVNAKKLIPDRKTEEALQDIPKGLDDLIKSVQQSNELDEKKQETDRKKDENEKRRIKEQRLEKRFKGLKKQVTKIVKPVKSIFDQIFGFLKTLIFGKIVVKLVKWLANPANQDKVNSIVKFFTDFGPKLLSLYLVFGTGVGKAIRRLTSLLIRSGIKLAAATLLLLKKMGLRKAGGLARVFLGRKGAALGALLQIAGTSAAVVGLSNFFDDDEEEVEEGKEEQNVKIPQLAGGGKVTGPTGIDKVPAMLTAGEFVMSKGAVQKFGVDRLMEMNAAGGGTNKPKIMEGKVFAQGGGFIGPFRQRGLARGTRATAGFTGMGKPGFDAISGGANYIQSNKPQILGRGAYSAPTMRGAMRYAGSQGSLGGSQVPGGVIKTIVPGGAPRIPILEPQMKVNPQTFDRGRTLANKLQSGYRPNSALANRLRAQMSGGVGQMPKMSMPKVNMSSVKNLRGGSPLSIIANLVLGDVLNRGVEMVAEPMGDALARTIIFAMGKEERAKESNPQLYGGQGPQLTRSMVQNYNANIVNTAPNVSLPEPISRPQPSVTVINTDDTQGAVSPPAQSGSFVPPIPSPPSSSSKIKILGITLPF